MRLVATNMVTLDADADRMLASRRSKLPGDVEEDRVAFHAILGLDLVGPFQGEIDLGFLSELGLVIDHRPDRDRTPPEAVMAVGESAAILPLTTRLARFIDVADLIKSHIASDDILRDLCDDYHLARKTLTNLKKQRPRHSARIEEYTILTAEIEDEIIGHLLDAGEQERT